MEKLDQVPWKQLKHAYGSAEDVPELLRALRTAPSDAPNDERSPLWNLFGNIWHQGTVYEATSYAVPFLLELAADAQTPDRVGILGLLAEIATGTGDNAAKAHEAVAAGFDILIKVAKDTSDVGLAAAHVLAQLPERVAEIGPLLRSFLDAETRNLQRAGLILLLGDLGDKSDAAMSALSRALSASDAMERQAAAVTVARLKPAPLPPGFRETILETLTVEECVSLAGLPWDVADEIDRYSSELLACLDGGDHDAMADRLISALEVDTASHRQVWLLLTLLFPRAEKGIPPRLTAKDLSPNQRRAVVAMLQVMETGKRIFYGHFPEWGLPDTMREWRNLAAERQPQAVDMSLPLLADPENPRKALRADRLTLGQRILHRHFGLGVVTRIEAGERHTQLTVKFDEEGNKHLRL